MRISRAQTPYTNVTLSIINENVGSVSKFVYLACIHITRSLGQRLGNKKKNKNEWNSLSFHEMLCMVDAVVGSISVVLP